MTLQNKTIEKLEYKIWDEIRSQVKYPLWNKIWVQALEKAERQVWNQIQNDLRK
jgi:hypothetical protein